MFITWTPCFTASQLSYYNLSNVCLFVCLFVPLLLPGPWADLHQTWRESGGRPRILAWGVHFLKGQGHRGQRSNLCVFFCLFPYFSRSLGRSSPNLVGRLRAAPDIRPRGSFFKGQGHRAQRSNFCISEILGPICMKLGKCLQVDPYLTSRGSFLKVKVIEVKGQISVSRQSLVRFA